MASTHNLGEGSGNKGSKQTKLEQMNYENKVKENENNIKNDNNYEYRPTKKHEFGGWGSTNPILDYKEGQMLLETGYKYGKQIYNITKDKKIIKFQPDNTGGHHCYEVYEQDDLPSKVLKMLFDDCKITKAEYSKLLKRKFKR